MKIALIGYGKMGKTIEKIAKNVRLCNAHTGVCNKHKKRAKRIKSGRVT